ncbi:CD81 antigen-like [Homarus americanus]|uniref:CD81 antigen-like n=1 Tax=Homarus americanus TaxID=6706 RepID=A0A8J5MNJ7_HOMAM|nr:CD81 antigen-like [Homarus americanus]
MSRGVEMTGCGKCIRFLMFAVNFVIWVASIAILVLGVWTVVDRPYLERLLGNDMYMTAAYILIATGCIVFFVSFLGCFGALREVKCMLLTYFIIVLLLFIILLIAGILGYVFKDKAETSVNHAMMNAMKEYRSGSNNTFTKAWDETQQALQECQTRPSESNSFTDGCFSMATDFVKQHALIIGGVGIAVAVIMVVGLMLSIILFKMIT